MEFVASFRGATISPDGKIRVVVESQSSDPYQLHAHLRGFNNATVLVCISREGDREAALRGQTGLGLEEKAPEPITVLACATCHRVIRAEGQEPGMICGYCLEGEIVEQTVPEMKCSNCQQAQEVDTAQPGDECSLCKEGRYMLIGQPAEPSGETGADADAPAEAEGPGDETAGQQPQGDLRVRTPGELTDDLRADMQAGRVVVELNGESVSPDQLDEKLEAWIKKAIREGGPDKAAE